MTATWLDLLREEVAKHGRGGITKVAAQLGVSRTAVSLLLAGKYGDKGKAKTDRMAARVLARFGQGRVLCPHLGEEIAVPACAQWRRRAQPTSDPAALRHWIACRKCPVGRALAAGAPPAEASLAAVKEDAA